VRINEVSASVLLENFNAELHARSMIQATFVAKCVHQLVGHSRSEHCEDDTRHSAAASAAAAAAGVANGL